MKTFSLDEARTLLPVLEGLLKRAIEGKQTAELCETKLQALNQRIFLAGGMLVNVVEAARTRAQREHNLRQAQDAISEIDAIGVQVKDLEIGLLDFPCQVGEETVLLCWKMGEADINFWHTLESGFAGRQPLDDRFQRGKDRQNRDARPN